MKVPLQHMSMKDLIEIILSFPTGLNQGEFLEVLGNIAKETLWEEDRDRFYREKTKAFEAKRRKAEKNNDTEFLERFETEDDIDDKDWQPISESTLNRLLSGKTRNPNSAALEEPPLMNLLTKFCHIYFHSDSEQMTQHIFRGLEERGYETQEWKERLAGGRNTSHQAFWEYLIRSAQSCGPGKAKRTVQTGRPVPVKQKPEPVQGDPDLDVRLLPDIMLRQRGNETLFRCNPEQGSPLAQILRERGGQRLFLLYGEGDSGTAGAGKTTALQYLQQEEGFRGGAYIPLWEVYNSFGMRKLRHEDGAPRALTWLEEQGTPATQNEPMFLLLDGLDEITAEEGIRAFCDDLAELAKDERFVIVLSSVLSPELLPAWSELRNISSLLGRFRKCCIQPLTPEQRQACLSDGAADYPQELTTPYLVSLCKDVNFAAAEQKELFYRWAAEEKPAGHSASLFFRSLAARICGWFRADQVNDVQNEWDSFVLMFALPAVAFHMALDEIYDENYAPEIRPVDSGTVERLLSMAFPVYKPSLHRYIPYQASDSALAVLADSMKNRGAEELLSEKTGAILTRSFDPETMEYTYRFANRTIRDGLAALHLANLFCAAEENLLPTGAEFDEFYTCPVRFLPHTMLESAAVLLEERMQEYGRGEWVLKNGPSRQRGGQNGFCRYLICSLSAAFSTALRLESEQRWRAETEQAYEELLDREPRLAGQFAMDHTANLCVQSRILRELGAYPAAAEKARASVRFARERNLLNADGYQALAMLYLTQVRDGLNLRRTWETYGTEIPKDDIVRAGVIFEELRRLAQLPVEGPLESEVFGVLPREGVSLIPDCLSLLEKSGLRLEAYRNVSFFDSEELEFLLTASFVAKAHSVWAALCPSASGAALNLLAGFFENDQERMEHDPSLPFFAARPCLHLPLDPEQLSYPERECSAARLYLRIIRLRRGLQPYSCRNLAQALLSRRFRLDGGGNPIPADPGEETFTEAENWLLEETTRRACTRLRPTYAIPRIRYLNERIDALVGQAGWEETVSRYKEEAAALFRREWTKGACGEKLDSQTETKADLLAVMLAGVYREEYLPGVDPDSWQTKISVYHVQCEHSDRLYTIGESFR